MSRYDEPETREIPLPDLTRRPQHPPRGRPRAQQAPRGRPLGRAQADPYADPPTVPATAPPRQPPKPPTKPPSTERTGGGGGAGRTAVRTLGEVLITLGLVVLLFVVYELYVTNLMSAQLQREANADLEAEWEQGRQLHAEPLDGKAFARIYIPVFGADWNFTVQQGVDSATLEVGPGHYKETAMPGEPGNMGVAGHRVGKGAPFNDLDLLSSCDAVVIETADSFFVYRVLPMRDEVAGWERRKARNPKCARVAPLQDEQGAYADTFGRVIVTPDRGDAVAPVPYQPADVLPKASQAALLTLTTCHPQFSDRERMIIHSVLTNQFQKEQGANYEDLLREIGEL